MAAWEKASVIAVAPIWIPLLLVFWLINLVLFGAARALYVFDGRNW